MLRRKPELEFSPPHPKLTHCRARGGVVIPQPQCVLAANLYMDTKAAALASHLRTAGPPPAIYPFTFYKPNLLFCQNMLRSETEVRRCQYLPTQPPKSLHRTPNAVPSFYDMYEKKAEKDLSYAAQLIENTWKSVSLRTSLASCAA